MTMPRSVVAVCCHGGSRNRHGIAPGGMTYLRATATSSCGTTKNTSRALGGALTNLRLARSRWQRASTSATRLVELRRQPPTKDPAADNRIGCLIGTIGGFHSGTEVSTAVE